MADKNKEGILAELEALKSAIEGVKTKMDSTTSMADILSSITNILMDLKDIKTVPSNDRWKSVGMFMLGGFAFILFFAVIGFLAS